MDKFDRKPAWKTRYRTYLLAGVGMVLLLAGYVALARFGDLWSFLKGMGFFYAALVLGSFGVGLFGAFKGYLAWLNQLAVQPIQGPGFTPLELAAFEELRHRSPLSGATLTSFLAAAEVTSRFNTGTGCITTIQSAKPYPLASADTVIAWFMIAGVPVPVGCRFWTDDSQVVDLLEFFTGGHDTHRFDWAATSFESAVSGSTPSPVIRPISTTPEPAHAKVLEQMKSQPRSSP